MEENKVMETVNEVVSDVTTDVEVPETTDLTVPDGVITEVPAIEDSTGKLDVVHVVLGGATILGVGYLLIKGGKWTIKKFGPKFKKSGKRKYAKIGDDTEVEEEYDDSMFENEDLDDIPAEETSEKTDEVNG